MIPRYPGGKKILGRRIEKFFPAVFERTVYVEPFVGGGGMLLHADGFDRYIINDIDPGVMGVFECIKNRPIELQQKIRQIEPTPQIWQQAKEQDGEGDAITRAVNKLILHACSHGGIGYKAGGPQGGLKQQSEYAIDCRWSPLSICRSIEQFQATANRWELYCNDFQELPVGGFCYADPPYVEAGNSLYRHGFTEGDHLRLRDWIVQFEDWLLSYDDNAYIRQIYGRHSVTRIDVASVNSTNKKQKELLICPTITSST